MKLDRTLVLAYLGVLTGKCAQGSVEEQLTTFSDNLAADMYSEDTNDCTSSLGISMAFDLLYSSATGESKTEMESVFGFSEAKLHWADNEVSTLYNGNCYDPSCEYQDPLVRIANRIWANDNVALNPEYQAVVQDFVQAIDFTSETAADTINAWVSETTNGLIDSVVQEVNSAWIILAVNSIYLKAAWRLPFMTFYTTQDSFSGTDAHFMHKVEYFPYSDTAISNHQIVQMSFFGGSDETQGLSMVFAVPVVEGVVPSLSSAEVVAALPQLSSSRVALSIPKFKFETTYESNLRASLQNIGLVAPFFGGLCVREGSCDAFIDFIIQKTVIDVNEEGVEAAAVTAIGVIESIPPPDAPTLMQLDRPFQFWIVHNGLPLFEGRVINPGIPEGSSAEPGLSHTDADFWTRNFMVDDPITVEPQQDVSSRVPSPSPVDSVSSQLPTSTDLETSEPTMISSDTPTSSVTATPTSPQSALQTSEQIERTGAPTVSPSVGSDLPSDVPNSFPGVGPDGTSSSSLRQILSAVVVALGSFILVAL